MMMMMKQIVELRQSKGSTNKGNNNDHNNHKSKNISEKNTKQARFFLL